MGESDVVVVDAGNGNGGSTDSSNSSGARIIPKSKSPRGGRHGHRRPRPDRLMSSAVGGVEQEASPLFDTVVLLDCLSGDDNDDQLFLLPDRVLAMDSISFREDVAGISPSFIPGGGGGANSQSPHNSLDSTDSNRSLKPIEESPSVVAGTPDGLRMARASNGCGTLWLCKREKDCSITRVRWMMAGGRFASGNVWLEKRDEGGEAFFLRAAFAQIAAEMKL